MSALERRLDRFGLLLALALVLTVGIGFALQGSRPVDADMVWRMAGADQLYGAVWGADPLSRYVYPPVVTQLVALLRPMGWVAFVVAWETLMFLALWAAARMWAPLVLGLGLGATLLWGLDTPLANPVLLALVGNVQSLVAAAIVIGMRRPAAWSAVLLTKVAPGIGLLWFVARGEWRRLGIAFGATAGIALVSLAFSPAQWADYVRFVVANAGTPPPIDVIAVPLFVRTPLVCGAVAWAARTNRPWVVPLAVAWASFALYTNSWISISIGALPLWSMGRHARRQASVVTQ